MKKKSPVVISATSLSKQYDLSGKPLSTNFRDLISHQFRKATPKKNTKIWALKDVSFEIFQGDVIGLLGPNGAGKSTLLKILSRVTTPSRGEAIIHGRIASLLEVGTGFHPDLTGRENMYVNGAIMGMRRNEIDEQFQKIVKFAEVEDFIDQPVRQYSSGMQMRLAFSTAVHLKNEILFIDEVLTVGDNNFREKCYWKIKQLILEDQRTILLVSHNMSVIKKYCKKAILLDKGKIISQGNTNEVIKKYKQII